jgi:hypothetical protein
MVHDVKMTQKEKEQTILILGIFRVVTIDTTNKVSRPEIHTRVGGKSWLNYRTFMCRVELVDTTNKRFLLDTTNNVFLLTPTMMNFRRTVLLG